jgi:hypothetical protein
MRSLLVVLVLLIMISLVAGVPSGSSVSLVGNNNATFTANSGAATAWFEYGLSPNTLVVWTPEQAAGGAYTYTELGSPLTSSRTYYVAGCDATGCDSPATFTMLDATPLPVTTYGLMITNATKNKFNLLMFTVNLPLPLAWLFPQTAFPFAISVCTALVLFAIYYGFAVRTRGVAIPIIMGVLGAPYLLYQNQGLNLGIPVEFQGVAQGIFYASLAGIVLVILRK